MNHATMNRIYRLVWNTALGIWVAVAENAKGRSKGGSARRAVLALAALLVFTHPCGHAADAANAAISAGSGSVSTSGAVTTIHQSSQRLAIDWSKLSTTASEALVFRQPNASSIALNRVTGSDPSQLLGSLSANGQVFVLNPNGVLFGPTSQVTAGGLVASTLSLTNDNFMAGKYSFANAGSSASVVNQGSVTTAEGGYISLLAPEVRNEGVLTARLGTTLLAAGNKVTLNLDNGSLVGWSIDEGAVNALAENKQLIKADGGQVILSARALDALATGAVNNTGFIEAQTVLNKAGRILLLGDMNHGSVHVAGKLDASAPAGGDGGFIETSAAGVQIDESATITTLARSGRTGSFLIDPDTWTINNGGPTTVGANNITSNTTLNTQLASNNVTIQTATGSGLITVNGAINWSAGTTLSLDAGGSTGNININRPISFSGGGLDLRAAGTITAGAAISGKSLTLNGGTWRQVAATLTTLTATDFRIAGGTFIRALAGDGSAALPYKLTDIYGVQGMGSAGMLDKSFELANAIDASGTKNWNANAGLVPIGTSAAPFSGTLNGANYSIAGLTIERSGETAVGMFGVIGSGNVANLTLSNVAIRGSNDVGGLAGQSSGVISNANVTGVVFGGFMLPNTTYVGGYSIGGIVGSNFGSLSNSSSASYVEGFSQVGGLVGFTDDGTRISNSHAIGGVVARDGYVGGLVGFASLANISNSYASGNVQAQNTSGSAGGLLGYSAATVSDSYATGNVNARSGFTGPEIGGLIGSNYGRVTGSYATGSVSGDTSFYVGGLIGRNFGTAANSYATGNVTGASFVGGLVGQNKGTVTSSYSTGNATRDAAGEAVGGLVGGNSFRIQNSFWNSQSSGLSVGVGSADFGSVSGAIGLNNQQMMTASNFTGAGWDLDAAGGTGKVWRIYEGHTAPLLRSFLTFKDIGATVTYNGAVQTVTAPLADPKILGTGTGASGKNAGSYRNGDYYSTQQGYDIKDTLVIQPRQITISGGREYNGSGALASGDLVSSGLVAGESIQLVNPYFDAVAYLQPGLDAASKDVGSYPIFFSTYLQVIGGQGTLASNYVLPGNYSPLANVTIRPRVISVTGSRAYDGTTLFSANNLNLQSVVSGETLTLSGNGTVANKNVGTGKLLTTTGLTLGNGPGTLASNYTLASGTPLVDITARALNVSATGQNKVYDGSSLAGVTLDSDKVIGDKLILTSSTANFSDKNVGNAKTITVGGITVTGTDAGNYSFNTATSTSADITARALTVSATGVNKVYDGNTQAGVTLGSNKVAGDVLTLSSSTANFSDKNVGTAKTITVGGITVTGTDAGNYSFNTAATTSADITYRALTVTAAGQKKVYDGSTVATVTFSSDKIAGDELNLTSGNAYFADKNVGVAKTIAVGGITVTGADAGNYTFNDGATTSADITARALTVTATGQNKVYDGNTLAGVTLDSDKVIGDLLTVRSSTANFSDKNVGNAKTITVGGITVTGIDAGNYSFNTAATTSADITARALTVTASGQNKVYDGSTLAGVTLDSDKVIGDLLTLRSSTANFSDKNVGNAKTITVGGITVTGTDAGNYSFNTAASTSADITARALNVTATGQNKVYDGSTVATVTFGSDKIAGDVLSLGGNATFSDKNVGTAKTITVGGITVTGTDAGNYSFNDGASTSADITARALTVTATGQNKVYDGNTLAGVTLGSDKVAGDVLNLSNGSASFSDKNVGNAKTITVGGITVTGTDAGNYSFNTTASTSADITARALTVTATGQNKVYDGSTVATVTFGSDKIAGDVLSLGGNATFSDKNVGTAKTITVGGITVTGTDAGNYSFNTTASTSADITARALNVSATGQNKVYDGSTVATVTFGSDKIAGDVLSLGGNAAFSDKNVGIAKTITVGGITVTGTDAGNYSFNTTASTSADITTRALNVSATGQNKVYDGSTLAAITLDSDKVAGDVLNLSNGSASFSDKNVGTAKTITVGGITVTGADAGNYSFNTAASTSADITYRALTVTATGQKKVYDGSTVATVTFSSDKIAGDELNLTSGNAYFADKNVGVAKTIAVGGITVTGADAGNYTFNDGATTSADITARALTVTATGQNKVYDGNTLAGVTLGSNKVAGDVLNLSSGTASFSDKNVGTAKTITVGGITVTGTDAGNYSFNTATSTSADITARALNVTASGQNKVYDGNTLAGVTLGSDKIAGDVLNLGSGAANFSDKNVGNAKTITVGGITVTGADAGNYSFNTAASTSADITARALNVTATGQNKVYDGSTVATVTFGSDKIAGDVLSLGGNATFSDKNVGTAKTITVGGITVTGTDAGNYNFNTTASTSADITARALTVTATGQNKVYDGNTLAGVTLGSDKIAGDVLNLGSGAANFSDKNVGTAKTITVGGITVTGADAGNYSFNTAASTSADITARALNVTATGQNKVYDGSTVATVTFGSDKIAGDVLSVGGNAAFSDKNVGIAKTITVGGITVTGTDAGNYSFNTATSTSADITARALTITASGQNKVYDGSTLAGVTLDSDKVIGDLLTLRSSTANFSDKNVGTAKTITVGGITVTGTDAGNYSFNTATSTSADITARALNVTATGQNKVYDGSTVATVTFGSDKIAGDVLSLGGNAAFSDKNVGTAKTITVGGITVTGTDAGNYSFNTATSTSADITARALTITASGQNKVYDGNTLASVTLSSDKVAGDVLNLSNGSASFSDKNVGIAKTITVGGITVTGTDAGNYSFNTAASTSADITARALTVTATGQNKVYDGNTLAGVTLGSDKVAGDVLNLSSSTANFSDKNVGTAKTITVGGITVTGADAGNYTFNDGASTSADITARALTVTATGQNKVYDGNTLAGVTLGSNKVAGDVLNLSSGTASFSDKNVGIAKTITVGGITVTGTDAGNYSFNTATSTSADITARALTVTATGQNKVYDGNTLAGVTLGSDKIAGDVLNLGSGAANFSDKNVGNAKTITVGGITVTGTDAGNYSFNTAASTSADITARALNVTATGQNKVYDGSTVATVTFGSDKIAGDVVSLGGNAAFSDKNVGTAKTITVGGITVTGTDAGNYSFNTAATTSADITARALNVTATGQNKVYDGNTLAGVTLGSDKVAGDVLNLSNGSASFSDKNVGNAKTITVGGITVTGTDAGNYSFNTATSTNADITARALTVTATGQNKVYDGNTLAGVTLGSDKVAGDVLNLSSGTASFNDKNVGIAKTITVGGITVTGTDAGNYSFNTAATTSADITARALNVTATGQNKVYDGSTVATVTFGSDKIAGDVLSLGGNAAFSDKNVGTAKTITVGGITVTGIDAGNYSFNTAATTSADITARALTVTASGQNKVYDGNTLASVTLSSDKVAGDDLHLAGSASFASKNAGSGIAISVLGIRTSGTDEGNYVLLNTSATTSADITPKTLLVTASNDSKRFDGRPYSGGNGLTFSGFVTGDSASDITGIPGWSGSSQGAYLAGAYAITPGGLLSQSGNYTLNYTSGTLTILPSIAYLNFGGFSSLIDVYACTLAELRTNCRWASDPEQAAAALNAAAAEDTK